jgi:hypothetical protein
MFTAEAASHTDDLTFKADMLEASIGMFISHKQAGCIGTEINCGNQIILH